MKSTLRNNGVRGPQIFLETRHQIDLIAKLQKKSRREVVELAIESYLDNLTKMISKEDLLSNGYSDQDWLLIEGVRDNGNSAVANEAEAE